MPLFFWKNKVSPLKQINADQLRALTERLIIYCGEHGNKIHSGTFILETGTTNLLEAIEQTFTGVTTFKSTIDLPTNDGFDNEYNDNNNHDSTIEKSYGKKCDKYDIENANKRKHKIPEWKLKRMEKAKSKHTKPKKIPKRCKERYLKFATPISLMAKRELLRKPNTDGSFAIIRWYNKRFASYNKPPRMVLLPYTSTVLPEEDIMEINPDNLEDEDMTENELLLSIINNIINDVIKKNPQKPIKKKNVYLNKDPETGTLYSFHQKKGKKLMQVQLLNDQNLNEEQLNEMDIFQLEMQINRLTGKKPEYKGIKKVEKLTENKRKQILIKEINASFKVRNDSFYNDIIMKRTQEIENEIAKYDKQLLIEVVGIYVNSFFINKQWHLALKLHSRRKQESKISKKFVAAENVINRIEKVPEDAYEFFCFLMLEVKNLKYHIEKLITSFEHKMLVLGWNKWYEATKLEKTEEEAISFRQRVITRISTFITSRKSTHKHSLTSKDILMLYPFSKYKYTYKMYRELNSLSKIHGKQFYDGLMTDLKKFGHRENQNPYLEYRLGREFYVNHDETLNILKDSKIALPIVMAKLQKRNCCALCCDRKKKGSIAASKTKNAVTDFANQNCPGPVATLVEKTYIFFAFILWVVCNCWKTPFFIHGYCIGLCFVDRDWRRTRRQIQRVEKMKEERVAFNKLTAIKRKLKRLELLKQQKNKIGFEVIEEGRQITTHDESMYTADNTVNYVNVGENKYG
jgi:hypothetical protein